MAITSANVGRVSLNMQMNLLQTGIQGTQVELLNEQEKIASGLEILRPSDNPEDAAAIMRMQDSLETQNQYLDNLNYAISVMNVADSALGSISDLLIDAQTRASDSIGSSASDEEREAAAVIIDSIINEIVNIANTQYLDSYIFGGTENTSPPFALDSNTVLYSGSQEAIAIEVAEYIEDDLSLVAEEIFGTGLGAITSFLDLSPAANSNTRLTSLDGAVDSGIRLGSLTISGSASGQTEIDLTSCKSLGDIIDKINNELPANLSVALGADGQRLTLSSTDPTESITVTESDDGMVARDLGIYTPTAAIGTIIGDSFEPDLTLQTEVGELMGGAGIDLTSGIIMTNGDKSVTLDFSAADNVEDILNIINASGLNVEATLNNDATGIKIVNNQAGTTLTIGENGGSTASDLGIRTMSGQTLLSDLNNGSGVNTVTGSDINIIASDGSLVSVDLSEAQTLQDVIDKINAEAIASGVSVTASLASVGNGIVLSDSTGGSDTFKVVRPDNLSNAAEDLGILQEVPADSDITGSDVNPIEEQSIFTQLINLRNALQSNDISGIQNASENLAILQEDFNTSRGELGYSAQAFANQQTRTQDTILSTEALLSNLHELDYTESTIKFQTLQTVLEANLQTSNMILQTSLLDYL